MQHLPRTNLKFYTVLTLALALLFGWSSVSFALPKLRPNRTYCDCSCNGKELIWEKVKSCSLDGRGCTSVDSTGQKTPGTLQNCHQCTTGGDAEFNNCVKAGMKAPSQGQTIPEPGGMAPPPGSPPKVPGTMAPGMTDPIMGRGIDDAELLTGPPEGADPSEPEAGGKPSRE